MALRFTVISEAEAVDAVTDSVEVAVIEPGALALPVHVRATVSDADSVTFDFEALCSAVSDCDSLSCGVAE